MLDQATFFRYVREVFARLDDRPYLSTHPLASSLVGAEKGVSPEALRQTLLNAIEELRPPEGTPPGSTNWRRWLCLHLRYAEGETTARIAQRLVVSERQARRDHLLGVEAVAAILWTRYLELKRRRGEASIHRAAMAMTEFADVLEIGQDDLDAEVARIMIADTEGQTSVVEALESALTTVRSLAENRQTRFTARIPHNPRSVAMNAAVLRQILLCLLTASLQVHEAAEVALTVENLGDQGRRI